MESKRYRHQIPGLVQQIDDCVRKCHSEQAVVDFKAVVKYTNRDSTRREQSIGVLFREAVVIVKKATITNHDWVGFEGESETGKKKD